jgi:hypothetical protein
MLTHFRCFLPGKGAATAAVDGFAAFKTKPCHVKH